MSRKVVFNVSCMATYKSELELPEDMDIKDEDELVYFINNNIMDARVGKLDWVADNDEVTISDIIGIRNENGDFENV